MPLITVLSESEENNSDENIKESLSSYDEAPPPIFEITEDGNQNRCHEDSNASKEICGRSIHDEIQLALKDSDECIQDDRLEREEGPSLMEQMLAEASKAKEQEDKVKQEKRRKEAKNKSSLSGFKKGFLNNDNKSRSNRHGKKKQETSRTVDKNKSQCISKSKTDENDDIIDIKHVKYSSSQHNRNSQLRINDVQEALVSGENDPCENLPSLVQKSFSSAGSDTKSSLLHIDGIQDAVHGQTPPLLDDLAKGEWASPELMSKIARNPRLQRFMTDPKYITILESMKKNPKDTLQSLQSQPEILATLNEFCSLMGDHFTELGENESKTRQKQKTSRQIGPLEKKALESHATCAKDFGWKNGESKEEEERVKAILADRDLSSILTDPDMQMIIKECGEVPGKMHYFMRSEMYGPKLRKLIQAGLLKVER